MFFGCEKQMINSVITENGQGDSDWENITTRHTGDPYIHGHLQPPPPLEEEESEEGPDDPE